MIRNTFARTAARSCTLVLALLSASAHAEPFLNIGSVTVFSGSSSPGNPTGTWTLGDKDWTYINSSPTWNGTEDIQLAENVNPALRSHQFLIDNLSSYDSPITLEIGYHVHINGVDGPGIYFRDVELGAITSGTTEEVWKDVYGSLADFNANTAPGSGTLANLYSLNGSKPPSVNLPAGLTDLWVRDTIQLSSGGSISSINNTFRQTNVPEIDPGSFGSVLALVLGSLGMFERRLRRRSRAAGDAESTPG